MSKVCMQSLEYVLGSTFSSAQLRKDGSHYLQLKMFVESNNGGKYLEKN